MLSLWLLTPCLDISGVPGTGKTATVHTVIRELKRMGPKQCELVDFTSKQFLSGE